MASADRKITIRAEMDTPAVVMRPGDTLILGFRTGLAPGVAARAVADLERQLPGVRVITIDPVDSVTVYRPQGASGE